MQPPGEAVGPVVIGVGQLVTTQLGEVAPEAVQLATGTFVVVVVPQVVTRNGDTDAEPDGVQVWTLVGPVVTVLQVVVVHALASVGPDGVQVAEGNVFTTGRQTTPGPGVQV